MGAEVALAFACGLAVFTLLSVPLAAADSRLLPAAALGIAGIGAVIAILRFLGVAYAVNAAIAGLLAFDWFSVPPTHPHAFPNAESLADLIVFLAAGALIGVLAASAGRRAATSERARSELAEEQAALRRVATLVAKGVPANQLFAAVAEEAGGLLEVDGTYIARYESEDVVARAFWSKPGYEGPRFDRFKLSKATVSREVRRTKRPVRIDDFEKIQQTTAFAGQPLIASLLAAPIVVESRLWGVMAAWSRREPLPADTEAHLAQFTDLVATAISNTEARTETRRLAEEQAALRRVATLVAEGVPPPEVFEAVTRELGQLLGVDSTYLSRYEPDDTSTGVGSWSAHGADLPMGTHVPHDSTSVAGLVHHSGQPARLDNYQQASGEVAEIVQALGIRSSVGAPVIVEGQPWGVLIASSSHTEPLPTDTESRIAAFSQLVATAISNTEARAETRRLAEEQAALRRVATLVAEGVPPPEVFAAVAEEAGPLLGADSTYLVRYEWDGTATGVGSWSSDGSHYPVGTRAPIDGRSVTGLVQSTGRPARLDDYDVASGEIAAMMREKGVRSSIGAPIVVDGQLWGVMAASSRNPEALPADTESRIARFTELVATAISNTEARTETRRLAEEQAALRHVATLVAQSVPPEELFLAVVEKVGTLFETDLATLLRYEDENTATLVSTWTADGAPLEGPRTWSMTEMGLTRTFAQDNWPTRVDDWNQFSGPLAEYVRDVAGVTSSVGSPIIVEGQLWGALAAHSTQPEPVPIGAELRLGQFTELVATAISNTEARTETRRLAEEQAALRRVATLVAKGVPPNELFDAVAAEVGGLLGADLTSLLRFERDDMHSPVAIWAAGGEPPEVPRFLPMAPQGLSATVARTGRPARIDDWESLSGPRVAFVRELGIVSSVGAPIMVEGRMWGALVVNTTHDSPLPPDTEARLEQFTELVATAISNTEARSDLSASRARIVAAADEERRRVVRDLHDGAQQRLVHTVVKLKLASRALAQESDEGPPLVTEALQHAVEATDELRELSHGILPSVLTQGGLRAGVGALASRMPLPVETGVSVDRLPPAVEATAYFIVAEALTNVAKHSQASHAVVTARTGNGTLQIQVKDDGVGGAQAGGTGLVGLADRVAALDGTLRLESPTDGGTLLAAEIPVLHQQ